MAMTFGNPAEQEAFATRNERFLKVLPGLIKRINEILAQRRFTPAGAAQTVVFFLGRLVAEDLMEVFLNCANGYGGAGLKLLRPMYEATVTALYIANHPEEAEAFLNYHVVHQRKLLKMAEAAGMDLTEVIPAEEQARVEEQYQAVKDRFRQTRCPECGEVLGDMSWTKRDPVAMSRELGLPQVSFGLYSYTTLHVHTTPTRLVARLEDTGEELRFKAAPQHAEADAALVGAHICITMILNGHNRYFGLGIEGLEDELIKGLQEAWPDRGDLRS